MWIKPKALKPGSRVAAVTLSWGGPGAFPHRFEVGAKQFDEAFGVEIVCMKHTMKSPEWIWRNPRCRAEDVMQAFQDESIDGIVSTIGGSDSIRLIPFLDVDVIRNNPKVFLGYSDSTVMHFACWKAGLVSFYGPSLMAGFAENGGLFPYMRDSVSRTIFSTKVLGELKSNADGWTKDIILWDKPTNQSILKKLQPARKWNFLCGSGEVAGVLIGGCVEVLEWLKCTPYWPEPERFQDAILFLETSEEGMPPVALERFLRNLGAQGILERLKGLLFGRPGGEHVSVDQFSGYDDAILKVICEEFSCGHLHVVTGLDFGHSDPMMVIPQGVTALINSTDRRIFVGESAVV